MRLRQIKISQLRNLLNVDLEPHEDINVLVGENGSGKTSFLEAIQILILSRSFRTHLNAHLINYDAEVATVFGLLSNLENSIRLGIEKSSSGTKMQLEGAPVTQVSAIAAQFPILLVSCDSFKLLQAGPGHRRKFLDWGLFHVEHSFFSVWQEFNKALQNRNALLRPRQAYDMEQFDVWNDIFVNSAEALHNLRMGYIDALIPVAQELLNKLLNVGELSLSYFSGWEKKSSLKEALNRSLSQDRLQGFTQFGPHRADLVIKVNGKPVQYILSRGQQKLLAVALQLAQAILLESSLGKKCIYLIDDIAAELDSVHSHKLFQAFFELEAQMFITAVDLTALPFFERVSENKIKMFHVKHGVVSLMPSAL